MQLSRLPGTQYCSHWYHAFTRKVDAITQFAQLSTVKVCKNLWAWSTSIAGSSPALHRRLYRSLRHCQKSRGNLPETKQCQRHSWIQVKHWHKQFYSLTLVRMHISHLPQTPQTWPWDLSSNSPSTIVWYLWCFLARIYGHQRGSTASSIVNSPHCTWAYDTSGF